MLVVTAVLFYAEVLSASAAAHMRSEGGTSIEDLAEKYPDKIIKIPVDIRQGEQQYC